MTFLLPRYWQGFTLIELLIAGLIVSILAAIALPSYTAYVDNVKNTKAIGCILEMQLSIEPYITLHHAPPEALNEINVRAGCTLDPWGNAYRYLEIEGKTGLAGNRKDRSENPLNSDYDLYSMGKDGKTQQSLRPKDSHDDIIRAKNGGFIGLASEY